MQLNAGVPSDGEKGRKEEGREEDRNEEGREVEEGRKRIRRRRKGDGKRK